MDTTDVLSSVLRLLRFRASVFFHSSYCGSWSVDTSGSGRSTFHLIAKGDCYLHLPGAAQAVALTTGDLVIFPRDSKHRITDELTPTSSAGAASCDAEQATALICGYFDFDDARRSSVIQALPECLLVRREGEGVEPRMQVLVDLMKTETDAADIGSDVVVDKLSEMLFIYALRSFIETESPGTGIFAALSDRHMSRAMNALHADPAAAWSVEKLAAQAGLSRAAFSKLFTSLMDQSPMQYLTEWRMQLASRALREGTRSVLEISEDVGYSSEAAFRKAFKKITGVGPGEVRRSG